MLSVVARHNRRLALRCSLQAAALSGNALVPTGEPATSRPIPKQKPPKERLKWDEWVKGKRLARSTIDQVLMKYPGSTKEEILQRSKENPGWVQFKSKSHLVRVLQHMQKLEEVYTKPSPNAINKHENWIYFLWRKGRSNRKIAPPKYATDKRSSASLSAAEKAAIRVYKEKLKKLGLWEKKKTREARPT
jgi:hypothetical protein